jgi:hypothetical protein
VKHFEYSPDHEQVTSLGISIREIEFVNIYREDCSTLMMIDMNDEGSAAQRKNHSSNAVGYQINWKLSFI